MNTTNSKATGQFELTIDYEQALFGIVELIVFDQHQAAQQALHQLLDDLKTSHDPQAVTYLVFAQALAGRLSGSVAEKANLYLQDYEVPQIHLFNLLTREVPLISLVDRVAIRLLTDVCQQREQLTLIDIGIGTGRQVVNLLHSLSVSRACPHELQIIGIEPSVSSLSLAQESILETARQLNMNVTFKSFCKEIEKFTYSDWSKLGSICDRPVINASFALHHIRDLEGQDVRTQVLQALRRLQPSLLLVSEPNVDHLERNFFTRFYNCWNHFKAVFQMIDSLAIDQASKDGLKVCFFGREVVDILQLNEGNRVERHEAAKSWVSRLCASGYTCKAPMMINSIASSNLNIQYQPHFLSFEYQQIPLVAMFCATWPA